MTELTKTLVFNLAIESGDAAVLNDAIQKARTVYNKTIEYYFNTSKTRDEIEGAINNEVNLIKNTIQRLIDKTYTAINAYYERDEYNRPKQKDDAYPLRSNHGEGYELTLDTDQIRFRVGAIPYGQKVRGTLNGSDEHLSLVKQALHGSEWSIGTSEVVQYSDSWQLHVNITHETATVASPTQSQTLIGVDINESNIALAALEEDEGVTDSIVLEYNEVRKKRQEYFTTRKRLQSNDKEAVIEQIGSEEKRFVTDELHKLTRKAVKWVKQFENPCIVLEDLKDMRDSIEYGSRMNRRLHSLPFGKIQQYITYKANFDGIPVVKADPEYTSQECLNCGHKSRSNRRKLRFKCVECDWQDHSDRKASVSIAERGITEIGLDWNVPPLNRLPVIRTEGCDGLASGGVKPPTTTHAIA